VTLSVLANWREYVSEKVPLFSSTISPTPARETPLDSYSLDTLMALGVLATNDCCESS
jgi:hypothetical protein